MRVTGIIAEYNPFHNGHKYHLEKARKMTGADKIVVVMSGDFTQRGMPALIDKYERARMALENGADLVIELPSCYACSSAEYFGDGAIAALDALGVVNSLCFGTESGNIEELFPIAQILATEPENFRIALRESLRNGNPFPRARNQALTHCIPGFAEKESILGLPNNILGIEYLKALINRGSIIQPVTIQRTDSDYHSYRLDQGFASSQALRQALSTADHNPSSFREVIERVRTQVPENVYEILYERFGNRYPIFPNDLSSMLVYKLLLERHHGYTSFVDVSEDLSDKLLKFTNHAYTFDQFCEGLKSKDLTYVRISRVLCHILLNVRKEDMENYKKAGSIFYTRVLGFREDAEDLLSEIKKRTKVPMITRVSQGDSLEGDIAQRQFERDVLASHFYESIVANKFGSGLMNEYERKVIKI